MDRNNSSDTEVGSSFAAICLLVVTAVLLIGSFTGCAQLVGVKEYHKDPGGGTHILFTTATDFTVGWGQYDEADKRKAIKPSAGYSTARRVVAQ